MNDVILTPASIIRPRRLAVLLAAATLLLLIAPAPPARAIEASTDYPAVDVEPGATATFDLNLDSETAERVRLSVTGAPAGWQTTIRGGGSVINAVHVQPESVPDVQVAVDVPADAEPGQHTVEVSTEAPSGDDTLRLVLSVVEQAGGTYELSTDFPRLEGGSDETFSFDVDLSNNTAQQARFAFETQGPDGWTLDASPALETNAATVTVDAGGTATVSVEADPPENVAAGEYTVRLIAKGKGRTLKQDLTVEVTGSPGLTLETRSERLNASGVAGDTTGIELVVTNDGSAPMQGVELSASPPSGWEVTFDPKTVSKIKPGESVTVTAEVTPAGEAIAGDYDLSITASGEGTSDSVDLRYAVETSSWWGFVGVMIIAAVVIGLLWAFRRYGRR